MSNFIAIDYETANSSYESVCAVGITVVENGEIFARYYSLIKPPKEYSYFDPFNTSIHGISERDVRKAPSFAEVWKDIESFYVEKNLPFACHYAGFDIRVTESMLFHIGANFQDIYFFDTCTISKKVWPELLNYKLNTIANFLGINLDHHNAASDAEACAKIALKQMELLSFDSLSKVAQNFGYDLGILSSKGVKRMSDSKRYPNTKTYEYGHYAQSSKGILPSGVINEESDLNGKNIVFTGGLQSMTRANAIQRAVNNGAKVISSVSKKTNYLVVGISEFINFEKGLTTNKYKEAEQMLADGFDICIIDEEEFLKMTL